MRRHPRLGFCTAEAISTPSKRHRAATHIAGEAVPGGLLTLEERERVSEARGDGLLQLAADAYYQSTIGLAPGLTAFARVRAQAELSKVALEPGDGTSPESELWLSPKVGLVLGPFRGAELYIDYGHTERRSHAAGTDEPHANNDPAVSTPFLAQVRGWEAGLRTGSDRALTGALFAFQLEAASEPELHGETLSLPKPLFAAARVRSCREVPALT